MTNAQLLHTVLRKVGTSMTSTTTDRNARVAKDVHRRIAAVRGQNLPKGLPSMPGNTDSTDCLYPTAHNMPTDRGWEGTRTITGSGGGPEL